VLFCGTRFGVLFVEIMEENYKALEVPGEPGVYWCAKHKNVQTRLRCGRCETPICPKCTKMGPTGARCPKCISNRASHIYQVSPLQLLLTFVVTALLGGFGALLVGRLGLLLLLFSPGVGTLLAKVVTRLTQGKRGVPLAVTAAAGVVVGAAAPLIASSLNFGAVSPMLLVGVGSVLLYVILVISSMWYWLK
jgi:hypothetical protein